MNLDVIVFAAHPDDAELSMGGTIAKLTKNNLKVGIIDFTKGELGTRGTPEIRQKEAAKASDILKIKVRDNLLFPDGNIQINKENLIKVVTILRKYKPKIIFAPFFKDRHPDHIDASTLTKRAMFQSGLKEIKTFNKDVPQDAYRPGHLYYYMQTYTFDPSFIIDISDSFDTKMKAVRAFSSQFHNPKNKEPETFISKPNFISYVESRASFYGFQIGKSYGEAFYCEEKIELDLISFLKK
jgi:bacillithiol biosynthesis deacetylase BshB1